MKKIILSLLLPHLFLAAFAQITGSENTSKDSTHLLNEVIVKAYEHDKPLKDVPAAIGILGKKDLDRFSNTSFLPAVNTIPGVRMEERSPGSYRLSIRGSTLRSPFGVRNVKVYWNDLPFTDPGGNTYLNLLDFNSIQQVQIIKGPGASLYGAGTGGVMLLTSPNFSSNQTALQASVIGGSYGLLRYSVGAQNSSKNVGTNIQYAHQESDGYRDQSRMRRDVIQTHGSFRINKKGVLSGNILYSDLYYQTPGGLTKTQYDLNPKQARPPAGANPGAVDQKAAVYNKTIYAGVSHEYEINSKWSNRTGIYGSYTQFDNPTVRTTVFERRKEQSFGGRSVTQYIFKRLKLNFGGEFQYGIIPKKIYKNNSGIAGQLLTNDEISSTTSLLFAQAELTLPHNFSFTVGSSLNYFTIHHTRLTDSVNTYQNRRFNPVLSPRIALLKKLTQKISAYGSASQGFSPPTADEIYPSANVFNNSLNPETGTNFEIGVRGTAINDVLKFDVVAYTFQLKDAITIRRNSDGADYFVNSGTTSQKGLELGLGWTPHLNDNGFVENFKVWTSATLNHYRFKHYNKDTVDLSRNTLTGSAPHIFVAGVDVSLRPHLYGNLTFSYTDRIFLNDENTVSASSYNLLGARFGYRPTIKKVLIDFFVGVDNAFDQKYSLGNDLNSSPAPRYYNAAAGRNFFIGLKTNLTFKKL